MGDAPPPEEDFSKLPIEDCITHKSWKARMNGFDRAGKLFRTLEPKESEFTKYLGCIKNFASESNVVALEKGLDALLAFVDNAAIANKTAGEVCPIIVQKCLGSPKTKIKEKAIEIMMMYIEIEKHDIVLDAMIEGFAAKNPKLVASCASSISLAVGSFGAKALGVKSAAKGIAGLLEHANNDVRKEGKTLAIELYSWVGKAINPQLTGIKPIQMTELENEFSSIEVGDKAVTRYLRSQQPKAEDIAAASIERVANVNDSLQAPVCSAPIEADPWDLLDPVDVLSKLPTDFDENMSAAKWLTRKDALEGLLQLIKDNPRLEPKASYGEIVATLRKSISKDSNINVVALAGQCLAGIATGLRTKFAPLAPSVVRDVLDKFKEKKPVVVKSLTEAIDAISATTSLESMLEDITASLENKSPPVRMQTALFLSRSLRKCNQQNLPKKTLKIVMAPLVKNMADPEVTVREATAAAIASGMKAVGEKAVLPFLADIVEDKLKMGKINEFRDKLAAECGNEVVTSMVQSMHKTNAPPQTQPPPVAKATPAKPPVKKIVGAKKAPVAKKAAAAGPKAPVVTEERELTNEDVDEKAVDLFEESVRTKLYAADWKERLEALTTICQIVEDKEKSDLPVQVVVKLLNRKKEMNFQALTKRFEVYGLLAGKCDLSSTVIALILPEALDKIGDAKQSSIVKVALTSICESVGLKYVVSQLSSTLMEQKNPKNQSEGLSWIANAIIEFGLDVEVKELIAMAQKGIASSNVTVRTAAFELCGTMYLFFGPQLRSFFASEKPALLASLDAEFAKHGGNKAPAPTRKRRGQVDKIVSSKTQEDNEIEEEDVEQCDPADLLRKDISDDITDEMIAKLSDSNWKVRDEGLTQVSNIIGEFKLKPTLGLLPDALCARLKDSNKNLASTALEITIKLLDAVGPKIREHIRGIVPGIMSLMGDSKVAIREKASGALRKWVEMCGIKDFLEGELIVDAFKDNNPMQKAEMWKWLSFSLTQSTKKLPDSDLKACIPALFASLEDRNPEVRKQAQEALVPIINNVGYDSLKRASERLKPASLKTVSEILDKARVEAKSATVQSSAPSTSRNQRSPNETAAPARGRSTSRKPETGGKSVSKETNDSGKDCPLIITAQKKQRNNDERTLKALKWQFPAPTEDHVQQLNNQLSTVCKPTLHAQMIHSDFKQHMKALDALIPCVETHPEAVIDCSDLLMRWCTLRFFETNPATVIKCLELVDNLLQVYVDKHMDIDDSEVNAFVPYLLLKAGDSKEPVRKSVRKILARMENLYPSEKLFPLLLEGCKTKNSRQKTECLRIMADNLELLGPSVCGPSPGPVIKALAGNIGDRDKDVRDAALTTMVALHMHLQDKLHRYIGSSISDKDNTMLTERLKRVKSRPVIKKAPSPEREKKVVRGAKAKSREGSIGAPGRDVEEDGPPPKKRPSGMFTLDDDDDVESEAPDIPEPSLINHTEVDEDMTRPVQLPKLKTPRGLSPSRRRASVTSISSIGSMDASMALDNVISQIACAGIESANNAAAQLEELLNDTGKACLVSGKVGQVLTAICMQLRITYMNHMAEQEDKSIVVLLYRNLCGLLLSLLSVDELAKEAQHGQLKDLAAQLLTVLLDERLETTKEGEQIIKLINVLLVKVVDKSEPTECLLALMQLLQESLRSHTASQKFQELVMKCIWKHCRRLPTMASQLRIQPILVEAHSFFDKFPPVFWKTQKVDTPMRTIKTLVNSLCKNIGPEILKSLEDSSIAEDSTMVLYLKKCLNEPPKQSQNGNSEKKEAPTNNSVVKDTNEGSKYNAEMSAIFKRIGDKQHSKQAISDLYDFTQSHPNVNMEPFLKKSSQFFQSYIQRNLELEAQKRLAGNEENIRSQDVEVTSSGASSALNKLSRLREQIGMAPSQISVASTENEPNLPNVRSTPVAPKSTARTEKTPLDPSTVKDLQALKRRLAEVKKGAL